MLTSQDMDTKRCSAYDQKHFFKITLKNQTLSKLNFISIIKKGFEYYYNVVGLHYQYEHNY